MPFIFTFFANLLLELYNFIPMRRLHLTGHGYYCAKEEFHANFYSFINFRTIRMYFNSRSELNLCNISSSIRFNIRAIESFQIITIWSISKVKARFSDTPCI